MIRIDFNFNFNLMDKNFQQKSYDEKNFNNDIELLQLLICPISGDVMKNPVIIPETGMSFDKESIDRWFLTHQPITCPITSKKLISKILIPNRIMKDVIDRLTKYLPEFIGEGLRQSSHSNEKIQEPNQNCKERKQQKCQINEEFVNFLESCEAQKIDYEKTIEKLEIRINELESTLSRCKCNSNFKLNKHPHNGIINSINKNSNNDVKNVNENNYNDNIINVNSSNKLKSSIEFKNTGQEYCNINNLDNCNNKLDDLNNVFNNKSTISN